MAALIPSASATGSGTMTLAGPSTNSNQTVSIPDATGTMMVSGNMPAFSVYNNTNQTISNNTVTKVAFQVKVFDTANCFDNTTNYRFTPNVAGYYQLNATAKMQNPAASGTIVITFIKNTSTYLSESQSPTNSGYNVAPVLSYLAYFNGTSDYVEVYITQVTGSSQTVVSNGTIATWFNGCLVRTA